MKCNISSPALLFSIFFFIFTLIIPSGKLFPQGSSASQPVIASITVQGNVKSDAELIIIACGLSEGQKLGADDIPKAIQNLWEMKVFKHIEILGEQTKEGLALTIHVSEYPRLESMEITGFDKVEEKDIRSQIGLFINQTVSPQHIKRAAARIKRVYASKGYLNADVQVKSYASESDTGKVLLKIKIDEGQKVKIRSISFFGNEAFSDNELRQNFKETHSHVSFFQWGQNGRSGRKHRFILEDTIREPAHFRWHKRGEFDEKKYREDLGHLLAYYKNNGYRDAQIVKDTTYFGNRNRDLFIDVWVEEGVKYYIGDIDWSGNALFSNRELTAALGFERGDVFNQEKYERAMQEKVNALYYDQGYIYAQIVPIEKTIAKDTLDIDFMVTEGNPVSIERVDIRNNTKTKEKVIRREVVSFPGETFSREALIRTQRNLMVLNYFENVIPDIQPVSADKVNVVITVAEKPTDTANLAIGYSAQDGFVGSAGVAFNNFLGNGQVVSLNVQLGGLGYRVFSVGFSEPYLFGTRTSFGSSLYYSFDGDRRARYLGYKSRSYGGSLSFGRRLKWPDDFFTVNYQVGYSNSSLRPYTADLYPQFTYGVQQTYTVGQVIQRDSRDAAEFPKSGSVYTLTTEAGMVTFDTTGYNNVIAQLPKNYMRFSFRGQNYIPAIWSLVLYTDFMFGYVRSFEKSSNIYDIPHLERFYMGGGALDIGSTQLRGYGNRAVGPKIGLYAAGGTTMFKYSAEVRLPVIPNPTMYLLTFFEAGNVFSNLQASDPFDVKRSWGFGFRLFMPMVGIMGLDIGYGIDKSNKRIGYPKYHFQLGQMF